LISQCTQLVTSNSSLKEPLSIPTTTEVMHRYFEYKDGKIVEPWLPCYFS
jgi:hypothetical protein